VKQKLEETRLQHLVNSWGSRGYHRLLDLNAKEVTAVKLGYCVKPRNSRSFYITNALMHLPEPLIRTLIRLPPVPSIKQVPTCYVVFHRAL